MSTYVPSFKGYMADVPEVWFKRCDNEVFHFDELTQASVNPNVQYTEINGGWSLFPVAYVPGQGTLEMQLTSAQFNADLFAMANSVVFEDDADFVEPHTAQLTVGDTHTAELAYTPIADSIHINGLTLADAQEDLTGEGKECLYKVDGKNLTFSNDVVGTVEVYYETEVETARSILVDNMAAATGEALLKWPVYAAGDSCSKNAIQGYVYMHIYKARVTAMPGFDTSYKSAATNQITLAAMDAKREKGEAYKLTYVDLGREAEANP